MLGGSGMLTPRAHAITAAVIEEERGVRRDSERSMFSDPWLPILPNAVLEKLIPQCVLTPGKDSLLGGGAGGSALGSLLETPQ